MMAQMKASTLCSLLDTFPNAMVRIDGCSDITFEVVEETNDNKAFNLIKKTAESEAQSGHNQKA